MSQLTPEQMYDSAIRTVTVVFASLFNNISVRKYNSNGSVSQKRQTVDIVFSDKQAYSVYCEQLMRFPDSTTPETGRRFPKLSYDLVSIEMDEQRQLQPWLYKSRIKNDINSISANTAYSPAAYAFHFSLSLWSKDMDSSIQVLEQILPYFKPEVSVKIIEQSELPVANDIHVSLKGITKNDNYLDGLTENRIIQWDMDFVVYANIWGKSTNGPIIKEVVVDLNTLKEL